MNLSIENVAYGVSWMFILTSISLICNDDIVVCSYSVFCSSSLVMPILEEPITTTFSVLFVWLWQSMTNHFAISVQNLTCKSFAAKHFCEYFIRGPRSSSRYFLRQLDFFNLTCFLFLRGQLKSCCSTCLCNLMCAPGLLANEILSFFASVELQWNTSNIIW